MNKERPWLYERSSSGQSLGGAHGWSHRLVLVPKDQEDEDLPEASNSAEVKLEERITSLEGKLDSQATVIAGLERKSDINKSLTLSWINILALIIGAVLGYFAAYR